MSDLCAALDFGTNTARLLIVRREGGGITPIHVEREIVRLGGGFTDEKGISGEAWSRGQACLKRFSLLLSRYGVTEVNASATSAVRDAVNGAAFVAEALAESGIKLAVIDGEREARLTLAGVLSCLDSQPESLVILDVGGGSTEFTLSRGGVPVFIRSMPIGVVRLIEGFPTHGGMVERVESVIDQLVNDLQTAGISVPPDAELVGTAGTATTIAAVHLEMEDYDYRKVNNATVSRLAIGAIFTRLSGLTLQERLAVKGLEKGREDLIIAGMLILMAVMDRFSFVRMKVSDFGLLEGLALSGGECDGK